LELHFIYLERNGQSVSHSQESFSRSAGSGSGDEDPLPGGE